MLRRSSLTMVILLCGCAAASGAMAASYNRTPMNAAGRLLAIHNIERARVNAPPLHWDPHLAASAASYGPELARMGHL